MERSTSTQSEIRLALTFDDGPTVYMDEMLGVLEKLGVRATFFVEGLKLMERPETVKRAAKIGCEIGNHSFAHEDLTRLSLREAVSSVAKTQRLISLAVPGAAPILRPPYGRHTPELVEAVGMPVVTWSADTADWDHKNADITFERIMENAEDGKIILMHVSHASTPEAVARALPLLLERGVKPVTVSELLKYKYGEVKNGVLYE